MDFVRYELTDSHIATITYDRPQRRNAIDGAMRRDINDAFERFRYDEDAWVGIVTGEGPVFSAGADLKAIASGQAGGLQTAKGGFGGIANYSQTLTAHQPFSVRRAAHDYVPADSGPLSTVAYSGIADVRASSSASDPTSFLYRGAAYSPWAALDGNPRTAWFSASLGSAVGQWLAVDLPVPSRVRTVRLRFAAGQPAYPTRLEIRTDSGALTSDVAPTSRPQEVPVPNGPTQAIRITVRAMSDPASNAPVGIAQLAVPGVAPSRTLLVPVHGTPDELVFATAPGRRAACLPIGSAAACDPAWRARGEEDDLLSRTFFAGHAGHVFDPRRDAAPPRLSDRRAARRLRPGPGDRVLCPDH